MSFPMTIHLRNLKLAAQLGVFDWERQSIREFPTQVEISLKVADSARADDLQATIDYAELEKFLLQQAAAQQWQLIERLVEALTTDCLQHFPQIDEIYMRIDKPGALEKSESAGVSYRKKRA